MIVRFVKMEFDPLKVDDFLLLFNKVKSQIENFPGCLSVKLLRDINNPCIFFTHSKWVSEIDLNQYRNSELFANTWAETKSYFNNKPAAWSLNVVE